jgi:hypothetical protein
MAWVFHAGIFYYGVRKFIYESPVLEDKAKMIADAIDVYLAGVMRMSEKDKDARPSRASSRRSDRLDLAVGR